ncbi:MAG: hypothetical protein RLY17_1987, partial [Pseudomonadota bacterium]
SFWVIEFIQRHDAEQGYLFRLWETG